MQYLQYYCSLLLNIICSTFGPPSLNTKQAQEMYAEARSLEEQHQREFTCMSMINASFVLVKFIYISLLNIGLRRYTTATNY